MKPAIIATEIAEGAAASFRTDLAENHRALTHARDQYRHWSWEARWRGGGPEYRAHCQDREKFFAGWIVRLERCRHSLLGRIAACAASPYRYLH